MSGPVRALSDVEGGIQAGQCKIVRRDTLLEALIVELTVKVAHDVDGLEARCRDPLNLTRPCERSPPCSSLLDSSSPRLPLNQDKYRRKKNSQQMKVSAVPVTGIEYCSYASQIGVLSERPPQGEGD